MASPAFLVIFIGSLSRSNDFVLFDVMDGNSALFANVLCDYSSFAHELNSNLWMET